jgi:hypothetical protein
LHPSIIIIIIISIIIISSSTTTSWYGRRALFEGGPYLPWRIYRMGGAFWRAGLEGGGRRDRPPPWAPRSQGPGALPLPSQKRTETTNPPTGGSPGSLPISRRYPPPPPQASSRASSPGAPTPRPHRPGHLRTQVPYFNDPPTVDSSRYPFALGSPPPPFSTTATSTTSLGPS